MTISRSLTADEFKAAPVDDQAFYTLGKDGKYTFSGEAPEEVKLRNMRSTTDLDKVAKERDALKAKLAEIDLQTREAEHAKKVESEDAKAVNAAWEAKHAEELKEREAKINELTQTILKQKRDAIINEVAEEISLPQNIHIVKLILKDRIDVTLDTHGKPQPIVYDEDKKVTRATIKDLTKEIQKDKRNAHILKGAEVGSGTTKPQEDDKTPSVPEIAVVPKQDGRFGEYDAYKQMDPQQKVKFLSGKFMR